MADESNESLIKFPCDFTLKIFGKASEEFEAAVFGIVHQHVPNLSDRAIQSQLSQHSKYQALTITVHVESKKQLDEIYEALSSHPLVIMVL